MNLTVIGTGYVGLVTGTCFAEMGNNVYCVDIDENKINNLKNGIIPNYEPHLATMVIENQDKNNLFFTTNLKEALDNSNIIFIAVGTPEAKDGGVNLDFVFNDSNESGFSSSQTMTISGDLTLGHSSSFIFINSSGEVQLCILNLISN